MRWGSSNKGQQLSVLHPKAPFRGNPAAFPGFFFGHLLSGSFSHGAETAMKSPIVKRSIILQGHRTSVSVDMVSVDDQRLIQQSEAERHSLVVEGGRSHDTGVMRFLPCRGAASAGPYRRMSAGR